jgi:hypothetical protein
MNRMLISVGALLVVAQVAAAQSVPNIITRPKQAATRAVAATNEHTERMTTIPGDSQPTRAGKAVEAPVGTRAATDSAGGSASLSGTPTKGTFDRETFAYEASGRRDPFISLMNTSELRPLITDLKLVGIAYDATGRSSIAVLRDLGTKDQYRVRVGSQLGRMRVSAISTRNVVFTIEEFGYSRQESLGLVDSNTEKKQ